MILVVVNPLSKYAHFLSLKHPFSIGDVAGISVKKWYDYMDIQHQSCLIEVVYSLVFFGRIVLSW